MREETRKLIEYYGIDDELDWLNFPIIRPRELQFHHIQKKAEGGTMDLNNGAILTPNAHRFLHTIERYDYEIYLAIKKMFELYVAQRMSPTVEQRMVMQAILNEFYKRHENTKTKKGKPIIKERYRI